MTGREPETPTERVAASLGLHIVAPAEGGEFGATFVSNQVGDRLVLKVVAGSDSAPEWARGAKLAGVLGATGYPCPRYEGTGTDGEVTWSLQRVLPGSLPSVTSTEHLGQLVALAECHANRAPAPEPSWAETAIGWARTRAAWFEHQEQTSHWGIELEGTLAGLDDTATRDVDVVHNDFHHRNYLADGDSVTGVFDWELAATGDWRFDLATLAFWSEVDRDRVSTDARAAARRALAAACPDRLSALFGALLTTRVIAFFAAFRPESLDRVLEAIGANIAPWWR